MNAYRIETRIPGNRILYIPITTFAAGEEVEVIIMPKKALGKEHLASYLHNTVIQYDNPTEPVAVNG
jgi:hypothetical protein